MVLRKGMEMPLVGNVQEQLLHLGYDPGRLDNVFDDYTEKAVKAYQEEAGLPVTGIVDARTWRALFGGRGMPENFFGPLGYLRSRAKPRVSEGYRIVVDRRVRRLRLYRGSSTLGDYPVAVGKPSTPTPVGNWSILNKRINPGGVFGTRWLQFTHRGHGIHGTNNPGSIGKAVSMGCVRMFNRHVETIYPLVDVGTPVTVVDGGLHGSSGGGSSGGSKPAGLGRMHTVRRGENLWAIARRYGTTVQALMAANNLSSTVIYPGQVLRIP